MVFLCFYLKCNSCGLTTATLEGMLCLFDFAGVHACGLFYHDPQAATYSKACGQSILRVVKGHNHKILMLADTLVLQRETIERHNRATMQLTPIKFQRQSMFRLSRHHIDAKIQNILKWSPIITRSASARSEHTGVVCHPHICC